VFALNLCTLGTFACSILCMFRPAVHKATTIRGDRSNFTHFWHVVRKATCCRSWVKVEVWVGLVFGNFERGVCMGCVFKDGLFLKRIDYGLCFLFGFFRFWTRSMYELCFLSWIF
jgi:hypothetical protein